MPRISSTHTFHYKSYTIPPGVALSSDAYHMHHNETIFPNSHNYVPSRWLSSPRGPDGTKLLSRYMVAFSRGTRMCLGMQLAYAEIYLTLATLIRRFEFDICEGVEREDVTASRDYLTPVPRDGSQGVRVIVK